MLRKVLTIGAVMLVGIVGFGGMASADPSYPANPTGSGELAFTGTDAILAVDGGEDGIAEGESFPVKGDGYLPGETISVTPTFTPNGAGLRSNRAFGTTTITLPSFETTADADGNFEFDYSYPEPGILEFTATGLTSGRVAVSSVQVGPAAAAAGDSSGMSTGGSIAIVVAAVLAAAALVFFGVLFLKRRKKEDEAVSSGIG